MSPAYKLMKDLTPEQLAKFRDILSRMDKNRDDVKFYQEHIETLDTEYTELQAEHAEFMKTIEVPEVKR